MKNLYIIILALLLSSFNYSQTQWLKYPGNPVLIPGPESWDNNDVSFGKILFDGTQYMMWYMGKGNIYQIGFATSPDGINWEKYPGNPILTPGDQGSWDAGGVGTPTVIFSGSLYHMWYAGSPTNPPSQIRIGYATSTDGIVWEKYSGNPVIELGSPGEWDDYWVTHPTVVMDGSTYNMWFTGSQIPLGTEKIGFATSPDGINWTKYNNPLTPNSPNAESDPVLEPTPERWDAFLVYQPCVIKNNSILEMWYTGNTNSGIQKIGYATSSDGIEWEKDPNPVLTENFALLGPSVLSNNNLYRMWYTSSNRRIYYAASDSSAITNIISDPELTPEYFFLSQNYPNPFNPSTVISYQLPVSSTVTLKIYDLLGREIATLVNEYKTAGSYEVEFDASNLSSGIYIYKLTAGEFTSVKKLMLLK